MRGAAEYKRQPKRRLDIDLRVVHNRETWHLVVVRIYKKIGSDTPSFEQRHVERSEQGAIVVPIWLDHILKEGPDIGDVIRDGFQGGLRLHGQLPKMVREA